jgi:hypothetical protein
MVAPCKDFLHQAIVLPSINAVVRETPATEVVMDRRTLGLTSHEAIGSPSEMTTMIIAATTQKQTTHSAPIPMTGKCAVTPVSHTWVWAVGESEPPGLLGGGCSLDDIVGELSDVEKAVGYIQMVGFIRIRIAVLYLRLSI